MVPRLGWHDDRHLARGCTAVSTPFPAGPTLATRTSISSLLLIRVCETPYAGRISQSVEAAGPAEDAVTPAAKICRSCGAVPHERARFCDGCGSQLVASVDTAEYKQVTVLFADVVRSMDIAAALDMERLREIMTELVERSAAVLRRYGGTVEYNGDGVMALFGAPVALEDHAFRACLAALAIQEEANRLAAEVAAPRWCRSSSAGGPEFGPGDRR